MADYQGKKIVIVGLGVTGLSCVDFFLGKGVCPQVMDTRAQPPGYQQLAADVPYHYGSWQTDWLNQADIIVVNPGLSVALAPLQTAKQHGAQIIGDIELFCREAAAPIIAITGSNGKSTVTTLVGEMAKQANWSVGVGGNLGLPALSLLKQPCQLYVLELSSFQLETTYSLEAAAATILNISEDHLDRYPQGLTQYCAAKQRIYQGAKHCIFNAEDEQTWPVHSSTQQLISVGIQQGEYHVAQQSDQLWLQQGSTPLINCAELPLVGLHNYFNALAALALADAVQIPRSASLSALRQFSGLAHRLQVVHQQDGVRWINDSKATNIGSTIAALRGLTTAGRIHLLLGGDGKGADFSPLAAYLQQTNLAIYCYGQDKAQLAALRPSITQITDTMAQAMQLIHGQLQAGDLVLLSPACASWDQFANFEHRGNEFTRLAKELSQ